MSMRVAAGVLLVSIAGFAAGWDQFRGPGSSGVAETGTLPAEIGPAKNVVWKVPVPAGKSSPVFSGDRLFLTAHEGDLLLTLCLDRRTGKQLWRREVARERKEHRHKLNDPAAPTPVTDGRSVYAFFADFGLVAYSVEGKELWRLPMGPFVSLQGVAASPLLMGSRLILVCDQTRDSFMVAVDGRTGEQIWRKDRPPAPTGAYSSPNRFGDQFVVAGPFELAGYAPETGERLWWIRGFPGQPKSSPVIHEGTVYAAAKGGAENNVTVIPYADALRGYDKDGDSRLTPPEMPVQILRGLFRHLDTSGDGALGEAEWNAVREFFDAKSTLVAVRPRGQGDQTETAIPWRYERNIPDVPTPLVYRNVVYMVQSGGIVTALDAASGVVRKQGRLQDALGDYYSSPVAGDGKIYIVSQAGKVSVLKAGGDWEVLSTADMEEECYSTPALVDGRIYLRTTSALYCFAGEKTTTASAAW